MAQPSARNPKNDVLFDNVKELLQGHSNARANDDGLTARQRLKQRRNQEVRHLYESRLPQREAGDSARAVIANAHHQQYDEPLETLSSGPTAEHHPAAPYREDYAHGQQQQHQQQQYHGQQQPQQHPVPPTDSDDRAPPPVPLMASLLSGRYYDAAPGMRVRDLAPQHGLGHRDTMERRQRLLVGPTRRWETPQQLIPPSLGHQQEQHHDQYQHDQYHYDQQQQHDQQQQQQQQRPETARTTNQPQQFERGSTLAAPPTERESRNATSANPHGRGERLSATAVRAAASTVPLSSWNPGPVKPTVTVPYTRATSVPPPPSTTRNPTTAAATFVPPTATAGRVTNATVSTLQGGGILHRDPRAAPAPATAAAAAATPSAHVDAAAAAAAGRVTNATASALQGGGILHRDPRAATVPLATAPLAATAAVPAPRRYDDDDASNGEEPAVWRRSASPARDAPAPTAAPRTERLAPPLGHSNYQSRVHAAAAHQAAVEAVAEYQQERRREPPREDVQRQRQQAGGVAPPWHTGTRADGARAVVPPPPPPPPPPVPALRPSATAVAGGHYGYTSHNPAPAAPASARAPPQDYAGSYFGRNQPPPAAVGRKLGPKPSTTSVNPITHTEQKSVGTDAGDNAPPKHLQRAINALRPVGGVSGGWIPTRTVDVNTDLTGRDGRRELMLTHPKMGFIDPRIAIVDPLAPPPGPTSARAQSSGPRFANRPIDTAKFLF